MLSQKKRFRVSKTSAQTAVEYLLLLASVTAIVMIGFRPYLTRVGEAGNVYYNKAVIGIIGNAPPNQADTITY